MIESTPGHDATRPNKNNGTGSGDLEWTLDVSLVANRLVWGGLIASFGGASLFVLTLMLAIMLFNERWESVGTIIGIGAMVFVFVMALALIAMALLGFRIPTRTRLTAKGVVQEQLSRRAGGLNILAVVLSPLTGARGATAAGSAALADARRTTSISWTEIFEARLLPARHEIRLRSHWRTMLQLRCPPELYEAIAVRIGEELERHASKRPTAPAGTPAPLRAILTVLLIPSSVLLMAPLPLEISVAMLIGVIGLGLVAVWTNGWAQRAAGALLLLASIAGPLLAWWRGDIYLAQEGAGAALALQFVLLAVFMLLGAAAASGRLRQRRQAGV